MDVSLDQILTRAWTEASEIDRLDTLDRYFAPGYVRHGSRDTDLGGFKLMLTELWTAFPDLETTTTHLVQQGDSVAYRWEATGTHLGPYLGAPPTGRVVMTWGLTLSRFEDSRIVEDWASWNELSVLRTLGVVPIDR